MPGWGERSGRLSRLPLLRQPRFRQLVLVMARSVAAHVADRSLIAALMRVSKDTLRLLAEFFFCSRWPRLSSRRMNRREVHLPLHVLEVLGTLREDCPLGSPPSLLPSLYSWPLASHIWARCPHAMVAGPVRPHGHSHGRDTLCGFPAPCRAHAGARRWPPGLPGYRCRRMTRSLKSSEPSARPSSFSISSARASMVLLAIMGSTMASRRPLRNAAAPRRAISDSSSL